MATMQVHGGAKTRQPVRSAATQPKPGAERNVPINFSAKPPKIRSTGGMVRQPTRGPRKP
jgi:hypothetical protein